MQVWRGDDAVPASGDRGVVTIGVFDGVHLGHQRIVSRALARAAELRLPAVAVTFEPLPEAVLRPESAPLQLTGIDRRLELLAGLGIDAAYVIEFTREFAAQEPQDFVQSVLVGALRAVDVVVGANFRFGRRAAGDVTLLAELGSAAGFMVDAVELVGASGSGVPGAAGAAGVADADGDGSAAVSSSRIRALVADGDVAAAAALLGRPHRVEGTVVHGDHRGRDLGYPTANVEPAEHLAVPADGVYAGWLDAMPAAISVGTNPTFGGRNRRVEAYVLDRGGLDLYGRHVGIDFGTWLRGMITFDGVEPLLAQMAADVEQCRALLSTAQGRDSASLSHG